MKRFDDDDRIKKYLMPCVGVYNRDVFECPECGKNIGDEYFKHVIGFSYAPVGFVNVVECPQCFCKYYSHTCDRHINLFLDFVENGWNLHHN